MEFNYLPSIVAAIVAVIFSTVWYIALNNVRATKRSTKPPAIWKVGVEFLRSFAVAYILAHLFISLHVLTSADAMRHAFWLWLAFPAVLFVGLTVWENMPPKDAIVHAGDWLIKLGLIAAIVGGWR